MPSLIRRAMEYIAMNLGAPGGKLYTRAEAEKLLADLAAIPGSPEGKGSIIVAGIIPEVDHLPVAVVRDAFQRADRESASSRRTFTLAELFTPDELRKPEDCILELNTQLATENTNGNLVSRAIVIVIGRPQTAPSDGPYR